MIHRRREIICYPAQKNPRSKTWEIKDGVQLGKGYFSEILQACKENNCDYVMKLVKHEFHENIENEVKLQKICAQHNVCPPVVDWWLCPNSNNYGGVVISPILKENLRQKIESDRHSNVNNDRKRIWAMLKKALKLLLELHKLNIVHQNVKLNHFMLDNNDNMFLIDMRDGKTFKRGEDKLIYTDYFSLVTSEYDDHVKFDVMLGIGDRIEDLVNTEIRELSLPNNPLTKQEDSLDTSFLTVKEAEERVVNKILRMSYQDTVNYSRKTRNTHSEFVGISQMKKNLRDMKGANHGSLTKFKEWAYNCEWEKFDHEYHEYDWWMFPINLSSLSKGWKYTVYESDIQELIQDPEYIADYVLGAKLLIRSWGWDIKTGELCPKPGEHQHWRDWDVRLRKLALSLKLFHRADLFEDLKKFATYLVKNGMLINPSERGEIIEIFDLRYIVDFNSSNFHHNPIPVISPIL